MLVDINAYETDLKPMISSDDFLNVCKTNDGIVCEIIVNGRIVLSDQS